MQTQHREHELLVEPPLLFDALTETEANTPSLARATHRLIEGFDEARTGFSRLEVYIDRLRPPDDSDHDDCDDHGCGAVRVRIVLVTLPSSGPARWWVMRVTDDNLDSPDDLALAEENEDGNGRLLGPPFSSPDEVRLATPGPSWPIVDISCGVLDRHQMYTSKIRHLLVDLRQRVPRTLAVLDDIQDHFCPGGRGCWIGSRLEIGCRWDAARGDFLCAETYHRDDTRWGERRGSRYFYLTSGTAVPHPRVRFRGGIAALTGRARAGGGRGPLLLEGAGAAAVITSVVLDGRTLWLVGSPSLTNDFGARLFVVADGAADAAAREITPRIGLEDLPLRRPIEGMGSNEPRVVQRDYPSYLLAYTPDRLVPTFRAEVVERTASRAIVRLLVSERQDRRDYVGGRGVYLVGLEMAADRLVADAVRIATDANTSMHSDLTLPATAVGVSVSRQPWRATLDVEPQREARPDEQNVLVLQRFADGACAASVDLDWVSASGFAFGVPRLRCAEGDAPRRVAIDADGRIGIRARDNADLELPYD